MKRLLLVVWLCAPFAGCGGETIGGNQHGDGSGTGGARSLVEAGTGGVRISSGGRAAGGSTGGATGGAVIADSGPVVYPDTGAPEQDGASAPDANFDCSDPPPVAPSPPPTPETMRPFAATYCAMAERCFPHYYPTRSFCEDYVACGARYAFGIPQADSWFTACREAMEATTECPISPVPLPCAGVTGGTAKEGESCQASVCVAGLACQYGDPDTCPVCVRPKARGEACTSSTPCETYHYCDEATSKCERFRGPHEACTLQRQHPCAAGRCEGGTCLPLSGVGDPCPTGQECGPGLACKAGVCATSYALPGAACSTDLPGVPCLGGICENGICVDICVNGELLPGYCSSDGACPADEFCDPSTTRCRPQLQDGARCRPGSNECRASSYCDPNTGCTPRRPLGASCDAGAQCESVYCQSGRCAPKCACRMP